MAAVAAMASASAAAMERVGEERVGGVERDAMVAGVVVAGKSTSAEGRGEAAVTEAKVEAKAGLAAVTARPEA